ncbi:MAG: hypothetical protein WC714_29530 [Candidatus Obscuribacterales bacterium]|jgi:hypothetical protein
MDPQWELFPQMYIAHDTISGAPIMSGNDKPHQATDGGRNRGDYKTEKETEDELKAKGTQVKAGSMQDDESVEEEAESGEQLSGNNARGSQKGYGKNQGKEPADRGAGHGPQGVRHGRVQP